MKFWETGRRVDAATINCDGDFKLLCKWVPSRKQKKTRRMLTTQREYRREVPRFWKQVKNDQLDHSSHQSENLLRDFRKRISVPVHSEQCSAPFPTMNDQRMGMGLSSNSAAAAFSPAVCSTREFYNSTMTIRPSHLTP
jgi:hypothetical protein